MSRSRARKNRNRYSSEQWQLRKVIARVSHYVASGSKTRVVFKLGNRKLILGPTKSEDHFDFFLMSEIKPYTFPVMLQKHIMNGNNRRFNKTIFDDAQYMHDRYWGSLEHPKPDYSLEAELNRLEHTPFSPEVIKHKTPKGDDVHVTKIGNHEVHWLNNPLIIHNSPKNNTFNY